MSDEDNVRERQDGDYTPPILAEPVGGPVPPWQPAESGEQQGPATGQT